MKQAWDLWAIEYVEDRCDPVLVDECDSHKGTCQVLPFRYRLFETRAEAREWCSDMNITNINSHLPIRKRAWYFRPVKVRETIEIIGR